MKIRPLYDRVVVRRKEEETATAGGIGPGASAGTPGYCASGSSIPESRISSSRRMMSKHICWVPCRVTPEMR